MRPLIQTPLGIALAALIASTGWAEPLPDERAARAECSYAEGGMAGMRQCLADMASSSEKSLRQADNDVQARLGKWDEDAKYRSLAKLKFQSSNAAFLKYREAHCAFAASLGGGGAGNTHEIGRLACVYELNSRRAAQLRSMIADLPVR